ncbi:hypothetical protein RvVAR0630_17060 [Agrobacterium vitis]|uniref:type VI secretion system amidase immunity protein Tai4 n=1 Tax=Agrobacterium vitis TaxID=373 RepID=UPI0015D86E44|nr:type VI secretion system amidase immunity protein Tai4 [Agrobacterium vitis]BCH59082.1 hypothetical protein RvVAR0630_17060 [Agrobacterium vitis]
MMYRLLLLGLVGLCVNSQIAAANDLAVGNGPQAAGRTYLQNYKDMVLATCISNAYKDDKGASADAGSSVSALRDWTYYDMDKSPDAMNALIEKFLMKNYSNPLAESEVKGVKFDFLKCLDLYHSKELNDQAKKYVVKPSHTYRQDNQSKGD